MTEAFETLKGIFALIGMATCLLGMVLVVMYSIDAKVDSIADSYEEGKEG